MSKLALSINMIKFHNNHENKIAMGVNCGLNGINVSEWNRHACPFKISASMNNEQVHINPTYMGDFFPLTHCMILTTCKNQFNPVPYK
jgi:hypothetical protein